MPSCKDCLHVEACEFISQRQEKFMNDFFNEQGREISVKFGLPDAEKCPHFKDRSRFVERPCKIGDKVFSLVGKGEIEKWTVTDIYFSDFGVADINILQIKVRSEDKDKGASFPSYYLGRSFFYTYEEAERALKERESE